MRRPIAILAAGALALLAACSDKPQTNAQGVKHDAAPWNGTGGNQPSAMAFSAPNWKVGDKASWREQLKTRTQNGQNDYVRD